MTAPMSNPPTTRLDTPLGRVELRWCGAELSGVHLGPRRDRASATLPTLVSGHVPADGAARRLVEEIVAYFGGAPVSLDGPVSLASGTPFQRRVWAALRRIPHGRCSSYGEVAGCLGLPAGAARAVGAACGRNPLPIVVPCHRVVAADGSLTGFSGGLEWKQALLALEGVPVCHGRVQRDST